MLNREERERVKRLRVEAERARENADKARTGLGLYPTFDHVIDTSVREAAIKEDEISAIRLNALRRLAGLRPIEKYERGWWHLWVMMALASLWLIVLPAYAILMQN
ncbi:hypothetical protein JYP49_06415 [Nitratireductor aquimarinus]|uniref:hypothetical protein n=1 Tax=Nitratireductor TaxID=245876 RepID=UPI0019D3A6FA|nr:MULTISPECIES: hypothetical protein [Nitratireductor]MBN7776881.1 hypothetical protein [Nitratireductor pacificus]MBN7780215.1 hypothetical protein [Nitratireductor pacificus]MBN7789022.1 hypothetical protein [Nitratireductor aquimarinus]MBY6099090.1 hypothetical protein [Nitratireductor aquimarinus]MCA1261372.1 hypothetical protein [Nitratireductor aquimarinus]